jgi:hypothetical protein
LRKSVAPQAEARALLAVMRDATAKRG